MIKEIPELVENQRKFFHSRKTKDIAYRKKTLKRLQNEIINREDDICDAIYADFKKPRFETLAAETQFVLADLKNTLKNMDLWAMREKVSSSWANWPSFDYIYKEPLGTVLIIAPWNYPFQLVFAPLIGAIAAGNTAVLKPSEVTPNTSKIVSEIVSTVFPAEYVTVVEGGVDVSQELLKQQWDYIFFTGSTRVGKIIYEAAAKHLTPVTLELGGKNPCIVDETASIGLAGKRIAWGKFLNGGQTCIAPDYILVEKSRKEELITSLKKNITSFYGQEIKKSSDYTRMVSANHYEGLKGLLEGENIIFGGETDSQDNFLSPTLVDEPSLDSKLMQDEIFGPILPIISYQNEEEIDTYLSNYAKPLATYVFSNRKYFQEKIIENYSFGGGAINDTIIQITNKKLPFGGVGKSGIGAYHGKKTFDIFSNHKSIIKKPNWLDMPMRYPPYKLSDNIAKKIKNIL